MVMSTLASLHIGRRIARGSGSAATRHSITSAIVDVIRGLVCAICISILFGCASNGPGEAPGGPVPAFRGPWYFVDPAVTDAALEFDMAIERKIDLDDARRQYDLLSIRGEPGRLIIAQVGDPEAGDGLIEIEIVEVRIGRADNREDEDAFGTLVKERLDDLQGRWVTGAGSSTE